MKAIYLLHGKNPKKGNLIFFYSFSILGTLALWFYYSDNFTMIQHIVFLALGMDILGGVAANMTQSTKQWWQSQSRAVQIAFLVFHAFQPLVYTLAFELPLFTFAPLYLYMLGTGVMLIFLKGEYNRMLSLAAAFVGIVLLLNSSIPDFLQWLVPAYLIKLLIGFCIKAD